MSDVVTARLISKVKHPSKTVNLLFEYRVVHTIQRTFEVNNCNRFPSISFANQKIVSIHITM